MIKYPLPLKIVRGRHPVVTQEFGNHSNDEYYVNHGINVGGIGHTGTDIVISGGGQNTYGTELVCPFPNALLNKVWFTDPMSTSGNGVECQFTDERGVIKLIVWHCSETIRQSEYKYGDTLGFIGNSGLTNPAPSVFNVWAGAHLHLGAKINDMLVDPRDVFDFGRWIISETDTSQEKDLPPFVYFINRVREALIKIIK